MKREKIVQESAFKQANSRRTNTYTFDAKEELGKVLHKIYQGLGRGALSDFMRDAVWEKWEKEKDRLTLEIKRNVELKIKQLGELVK